MSLYMDFFLEGIPACFIVSMSSREFGREGSEEAEQKQLQQQEKHDFKG